MEMFNLFPTGVGFFKYEPGITPEEKQFIEDLARSPNEGNETSVNKKLFEEPGLKKIAEYVKECVDQYFNETFLPFHDVELQFTQSWANYSEKGRWHHQHRHPNSLLSGCFYVNAVESDKITFFTNTEYDRIQIYSENFNLYNSTSWWLPVRTNDIVIFPSNLAHNVPPVEADDTRISIAFNTFPKGYLGNDDNLTGLHL